MHIRHRWRVLSRFLFFLVLPCCMPGVLAQEKPPESTPQRDDILIRYETLRKDKASGLAWSLLVPGGGVFYAGTHNAYGAGLALLQVATLGSTIYIADQVAVGNELPGDRSAVKVFAALFLIAKTVEIVYSFRLIDDYNLALLEELRGREPRAVLSPLSRIGPLPPPETLLTVRIPL